MVNLQVLPGALTTNCVILTMANFKHNFGQITRPDFEDGTYGRVRDCIWSLPGLSEGARFLLAWADSRPPDWVPVVQYIRQELLWGKDKWRRVRDELDSKGWLRHNHVRASDQYTDHSLEFDLSKLEALAQSPRVGRDRTIRDASARNTRTSHDALCSKPSKQEQKNRGNTTTDGNVNRPAKPGGGDEVFEGDGPLALPGFTSGIVGTQLESFLNPSEAKKVNQESAGLSAGLAAEVVKEVSRQVAGGKVRSVTGLSVTLVRAAIRGGLVVNEKLNDVLPAAIEADAIWRRRQEFVGWSVNHPSKGRLVIQPEAKTWRNEKGEIIAGPAVLKLWNKVEAGTLILDKPPAQRRIQ